jgi:hypothetical protein
VVVVVVVVVLLLLSVGCKLFLNGVVLLSQSLFPYDGAFELEPGRLEL